jgi:L,D-peptidoglycan transpeptidase YkuD (ErfK/YbiS/YcfS/YnhG family)
MRRALQVALVAGAIGWLIGVAAPAPAGAKVPAERARAQLIVVVADTWSATVGELRRFVRARGGAWTAVGRPLRVSLGHGGLGWAQDQHLATDEPQKIEGDKRAPAGRFALGLVTGYDAAPPAGTRMPYRQATAALRCVDDVASPEYNREVDLPDGGAPWASDEAMRREDGQYRLTIYIAHNPSRTPGLGSCIFLHVWRAADAPTVGCTAMALGDLEQLVQWLDPAQHPMLVQLPRRQYLQLQRDWDLPALDGKRK